MASFLSKKLKSDVDYLPLGKPAVKGSRFVVGTEAEDEKQHFIICCDADRMQQSSRADPILHYLAVPEVWLVVLKPRSHFFPSVAGSRHSVAGTRSPHHSQFDRQNPHVHRFRSRRNEACGSAFEFSHVFTRSEQANLLLGMVTLSANWPLISSIPTASPLAVSCLVCMHIFHACIAGHDQYVRVYDVERRTEVDKVKLNGVVGSVKWPEFNQSTIDDCPLSLKVVCRRLPERNHRRRLLFCV